MIAIVKYNAGNIRSVMNAVERLGFASVITDDIKEIEKAEKVILPGVGEAGSAMKHLKERGLDRVLKSLSQPLLGICLGLQLMCSESEEGDTKCLGIYDLKVKKLPPLNKVPHMGWNNFTSVSGVLFKGVDIREDVYYVHSYYAGICSDTVAESNYIVPFSAAIRKENFFSTQFHPEKSAGVGEKILRNFLEI